MCVRGRENNEELLKISEGDGDIRNLRWGFRNKIKEQAVELLSWMERKVANNIKIKNHFYFVLE